MIFSVFFFGAASLLSALSPNLAILIGLRFLTGFGLGGAMPSAVTLTSEFCPEARRSFLVTLMFCGFTLGSALGGVVASQIVADYGWRSVLVVGGLLPLLLMPVLWWALPESVRYLVMKGGQDQRIAIALHRIGPEADLTDVTFVGAQKPHGSPVRQLFEPDLCRGTMLLWLTFFMGLVIIYMLSNWLPTLIHNSGVSLRTASLITAAFQIGGTVGSIVLGRLMDSFNPYYVLGLSYASGGAFVFLIGTSSGIPWLMVLAIFGAGFSVSGSQVGANALAAAFYPTANRATGVAWANGIGRIGAVSGSMLGGLMLSLGLSMSAVFAVMAVPGFIAGASIFQMGKVGLRSRSRQVMKHS